ncbi:MAG: 4Fe-4S binding protein [Pseudomonadota bacterium]
MTPQYKVCNCNRTMSIDGEALGSALGQTPLPIATQLCRREAGNYLAALDGAAPLVVGCTQEQPLFEQLAQQQQRSAPLRFVNLRESGGWSAQAAHALPKMAALLAAAALPDPEPVAEVAYQSAGRLLVIGAQTLATDWAGRLAAQLDVSVLCTATDGAPLMERRFPTWSGGAVKVDGWLGAFTVHWEQANPIDLDLCTRCMGCVAACPEGAIGLDLQVDLLACRSHRDCVAICGAVGAIDFARSASARSAEFDLVLDLSGTPLLRRHALPQGYFAPGPSAQRQAEAALAITALVGEFSKPQFFHYKEQLCAHSRNRSIGCNACIDTCSAEAIAGDGDHIKVEPHLCVGCGACTTVCPSGALTYAYPRAPDLGQRLQTLLGTYARSSGRQGALLLHNEGGGQRLLLELGRLAATGALAGMPARLIPVALEHVASAGIDVWLSAVTYGATHLAILCTGEEAPQYLDALAQQAAIAQAILNGLGYAGTHVTLLRAGDAADLDRQLQALPLGQVPAQAAAFHLAAAKRNTLDMVLAHLLKYAPAPSDEIALPPGAPYGQVKVDTQACTLCMSCVGACPASALTDNPSLPQLRFTERNCVQCGLCATTCPEKAITLAPRLLLTPAAKQAQVVNEAEPYHCIRCHTPFGTLKMIENMLGKLSAHGAFADNLDRLRMCPDCRVVDMLEREGETRITDLKR